MSSSGLKAYHSISTKKRPKRSSRIQTPQLIKDLSSEKHQLIFISAEVAPWSKTGGLGDVIGSLPFALAARGHRIMVVTPRSLFHHTSS